MNVKQVLQIDYKEKDGLVLNWKYTDLGKYLTFFRHTIIIFSENKEKSNRFLKSYVRKLRPGDLYTILYFKSHDKLKKSSWKQKLLSNQNFFLEPIIKKNPILGDKQILMSQTEIQFNQFSEPIVVSIYSDSLKEREWFQSRIHKQRLNNKYDFIVGMFGQFNNTCYSFSNKTCIIPFTQQNTQELQFFFKQLYQSAVIWARVTIQCCNGSIDSTDQNIWANINFNTIQKVYRGTSIKYQKDVLIFYRQKLKQMDYNLLLKLTYVTLQRKMYVSEKQFTVHSVGSFQYESFNISGWLKPYHFSGNVWLDQNPFKSLTVIKFKPQNQDKQ